MIVVTDIAGLSPWKGGAFVPTMGALHEGHLSLIRQAAEIGRPVVVSIYVNPTQFAPSEDLDRYPRQLEADLAAAEAAGADVAFTPRTETVYPADGSIEVPALPDVATSPGLEDATRPQFFAGVCQVVARLFDLVQPRWAVFGEKDYQQLLTIRAMVAAEGDRWPELAIVTGATVREPDGLAMSSRNAYLDEAARQRAVGLHRALRKAQGWEGPAEAEAVMQAVLQEDGLDVEYAVVRDAATLMPIETWDRPARALIAARLGDVRLIDNADVRGGEEEDDD